jgi:signal transduction histidine kinase
MIPCLAPFASLRTAACLALVLVAAAGPTAASEGKATKASVEAILEQAAKLYKAGGKDKLLQAVAAKDPRFAKGELYVVVYDLNGVVLAHPVNPKLVGKDLVNVPDVDGKLFRKEFVEVVKSKGSGWVDYRYRNPETNQVEAKTSKVLKLGEDCFAMAGMYKP